MLKTNHDFESQYWIPSIPPPFSLECESQSACPFGSGWLSRSHCLLQIWHWPGPNRRYGELSLVGDQATDAERGCSQGLSNLHPYTSTLFWHSDQ